eukprot:gnl/TRDRNA2_/TRDRNA2_76452_c0_seq1.p1 gnl/TRDRNA2_/TRDRNA2_76452_c0~~gnl/TRDRNA2_/TRDRNA2_76452_c0_seq1.p1  ORF type:complete len:220 (+),score=30.94 gnl/TRDRNA2_/TRDRNA2_76452_c0_seq1:98-661(+)
MKFYVCHGDETRSTTDASLAYDSTWCGHKTNAVDVEACTCGDLVDHFGPPAHVKIDVEGSDLDCIESLLLSVAAQGGPLPSSVSVEAMIGHAGRADIERTLDLLRTLRNAGYVRFKLCRQAIFNPPFWGAQLASSGPFGEVATDWKTGLAWRTADEVAGDFEEILSIRGQGGLVAEWFDLHAASQYD